MSFVATVLAFGALCFAGAFVGDPFAPSEWQTTITRNSAR